MPNNFRHAQYRGDGTQIDDPQKLGDLNDSQLALAKILMSQEGISRFSNAIAATAVGAYVGTGISLSVNVGFVPTLFMVKDISAATALAWTVNVASWNGRTSTFRNELTLDNGIIINKDGTVTIGTNSVINTAASNYEWMAFADNGKNCLILRDHAGNDQTTRTLKYANGTKIKAAIWKRDSSVFPIAAIRGKSSRLVDGNTSTASVTIEESGDISIVGNSNEINIWSGGSGESTAMLGFRDGAESIYVTTYTGNGGTLNFQTPFDDCEALLIFPRGATGKAGVFWTSRLAAGTTLSVSNESAATVGASCIASQSNGRFVLSTDTRVNASGTEYLAIAFRKQRIAPGQPISIRTPRRLKSTANLVLPSSTYLNAGTSDSLKINGAITMEWWGAHFNQTTGGLSVGAGVNNTTTQQQALMWRSNGADATEGAVSYGIALINPIAPGGEGFPVIAIPTSGFFDLPQTSTTAVDNNAPWMTGSQVPMRTMQHILVTHNGTGFWNVYLNGQLVKERNRNNLLAATPRPNILSGSGHTLCFGARKRASTPELANYFYCIYGARIYNRELAPEEAVANYNALFDDNPFTVVRGFVEEWLVSNCTSALSIPASNNPTENSAIVVGANPQLSGF